MQEVPGPLLWLNKAGVPPLQTHRQGLLALKWSNPPGADLKPPHPAVVPGAVEGRVSRRRVWHGQHGHVQRKVGSRLHNHRHVVADLTLWETR